MDPTQGLGTEEKQLINYADGHKLQSYDDPDPPLHDIIKHLECHFNWEHILAAVLFYSVFAIS